MAECRPAPGLRRLARERRAAVALEFTVASLGFLALLLACLETGYDLYVQEAMDDAVNTAARLVFTGQKIGPYSAAQFISQALCPAVQGLLVCENLSVNVVPVPGGDYYSFTPPAFGATGNGVCTGLPGQAMLLQAWYTGPSFLGTLIPAFSMELNGQLTHLTYASAAFVNEQFVGGQTCS